MRNNVIMFLCGTIFGSTVTYVTMDVMSYLNSWRAERMTNVKAFGGGDENSNSEDINEE